MKIFKYKFKLFFIISFILIFIDCVPKFNNIKDAMKDYPSQDRKNGKPPKFVYIKMLKQRVNEIDYFSKILYRFMATMGVRPYFVNIEDDVLLGIVPRDAEIDKEAILNTFKDAIESVEVKEKMQ